MTDKTLAWAIKAIEVQRDKARLEASQYLRGLHNPAHSEDKYEPYRMFCDRMYDRRTRRANDYADILDILRQVNVPQS